MITYELDKTENIRRLNDEGCLTPASLSPPSNSVFLSKTWILDSFYGSTQTYFNNYCFVEHVCEWKNDNDYEYDFFITIKFNVKVI